MAADAEPLESPAALDVIYYELERNRADKLAH
jgi:hypothetical protein